MARLVEAMDAVQTELKFVNMENFPDVGVIKIDSEYIKYTVSEPFKLSRMTRGYFGSTPATHARKSLVILASTLLERSDANTVVLSSPSSISIDDVSNNSIIRITTIVTDTLVLTLPDVNNLAIKSLTVEHEGAGTLSIDGYPIASGESLDFVFNGATWSKEQDLAGGSAGGYDTQIQYNSGGSFAGASGVITDGYGITLSLGGHTKLTNVDVSADSTPGPNGGNLTLTSGKNWNYLDSNTGNGGKLTITSGDVGDPLGSCSGTSGASGGILITTGTGRNLSGGASDKSGNSGDLIITTGSCLGNENPLVSGDGGDIILKSGDIPIPGYGGADSRQSGAGGSITLTSGDVSGGGNYNISGPGGSITLTSGTASGTNADAGEGGSITLTASDPAKGGNITLTGTNTGKGQVSAKTLISDSVIAKTDSLVLKPAVDGETAIQFLDTGDGFVCGVDTDNAAFVAGYITAPAGSRVRMDADRGFTPPKLTAADITALGVVDEGTMVYDTTNHVLKVYDGSVWQSCW